MAETVRIIVTCYLINVDWKPVAILQDKKKSEQLVELAKKKGRDSFLKEMTVPEERMNEIGNNIFNRLKDMKQETVNDIVNIRNAAIRESFELAEVRKVAVDVAWMKVREKKVAPIPELTYEEFNRWTLDVAQFVLLKR